MENVCFLLLVIFSSGCIYTIAKKRFSVPTRSLRAVTRTILACIGASMLCLAFNLTLGAAIIFLIRGVTTHFVTLYTLENLTLLILSVAQGFVFQLWLHDV